MVRRHGAARDAVRVGALAPMRRCVNACGENVCTCTHDEGGACRRVLGVLVARGWTSSGCGVDHAAPCADAAALPPRALWGTTPRAASLVLVLVLRSYDTSGSLARVGVSLIFVASLS